MGVADIRLDGTVAIVTGAARGLGQAMAIGLARAGADVVFADIDGAALADAAAAIAGQPNCGKALGIRCDITSRADCERSVAETLKRFGALHVLVNNAAKGQVHLERSPRTKSLKFWESDPDIWQRRHRHQRQRHVPDGAHRGAAHARAPAAAASSTSPPACRPCSAATTRPTA